MELVPSSTARPSRVAGRPGSKHGLRRVGSSRHGCETKRARGASRPVCAATSDRREQAAAGPGRRAALQQLTAGLLGAATLQLRPQAADAALLQFPAAELRNTYYLMRAGEGECEAEGFVLTNPVAKTSMSSGLSAAGRRQVFAAVEQLRELGACREGCWLWPSICQRSYQTGEIFAEQLGLSRSRIVPEYSFLDARGLGSYEGLKIDAALRMTSEGDSVSPDWRPPRGVDGTPNESVADVFVRVRQVMSITETQYSEEEIVIIAPDSDNLSILQAALLGVDLRQHRRLAFRPGEVRQAVLSAEAPQLLSRTFACPNPPSCKPAA